MSAMDRRRFLVDAGLLASVAACGIWESDSRTAVGELDGGSDVPFHPEDWSSVRAQFATPERPIDLSSLYISSHPAPVRHAIDEHRRGLDREPTRYLMRNNVPATRATVNAAARFIGGDPDDVALVDSTTMGLGLLYNGLRLRPGDDILTTEHDYYVTHESLRQASEGSGAEVRLIPLYDRVEDANEQEIVGRIVAAIRPRTRVLALTWVHSGTGLKLPMAAIAEAVAGVNDGRDDDERVLICLDGVHGLGVENATMEELGCDFFAAGTHKWVFGPRGTGIVWGRGDRWANARPLVPSFLDDASWAAWGRREDPAGRPDGERMTPGGFKPYEHRWALAQAFGFLEAIGGDRVAARTRGMARQLKEGLAGIPGVRVVTPMDEALSSGIVCCDVEGRSADSAVAALNRNEVVATVTPYEIEYVRFAPSIRNAPEDIEAALAAMRAIT